VCNASLEIAFVVEFEGCFELVFPLLHVESVWQCEIFDDGRCDCAVVKIDKVTVGIGDRERAIALGRFAETRK